MSVSEERGHAAPAVQPAAATVAALVQMGRLVSGADVLKAEQLRTRLMAGFRTVFERADVVVTPTGPITAPRVGEFSVQVAGGEESALSATWRLTYPFNLTGLPAITLPCGFDGDGLPIGLQIAGRPFDEPTVLRAAHAYEAAHDWARRHPAMAAA